MTVLVPENSVSETVAEFVMTVPEAVPLVTRKVRESVFAELPFARAAE